jgi:hypothetical protein
MRHAPRPVKPTLAAIAVLAAMSLPILASPSLAASPAPIAHVAGTCSLKGHERALGPTYVTALSVAGGASCSQAMRLVHNYYKCRLSHGGKTGHCGGVEGFRCSETRFAKIVVQFDARVTCTRGREVVKHTFTQFT